MRNAVSFFATESTAWVHAQYQPGDVIEPLRALPSNVEAVTVARLGADGVKEETLPADGGTFAFDRTHTLGPLRFTIGDERAYTTINLTDERESRIRPTPLEADPTRRLHLSAPLAGTVPWLALAMLASGLITLEWLTYHFRWTE